LRIGVDGEESHCFVEDYATAWSGVVTVALKPEQCVSVLGKHGDYNESTRAGFHQALRDLGNVGFVFGGGCFYGHGVNVIGGSARFLATEYFVQ
jgi:hypothetical protein